MDKLTVIPALGLCALLALALGSVAQYGADRTADAHAATWQACDVIHASIDGASLDAVDTQAQIKLAAARDGVPESIRNAVDAYYRDPGDAGRQAMLTSCADAGYPA